MIVKKIVAKKIEKQTEEEFVLHCHKQPVCFGKSETTSQGKAKPKKLRTCEKKSGNVTKNEIGKI